MAKEKKTAASDSQEDSTDGKTLTRYTTIKVRLYPTKEQAALFNKTFGCCRYIWNQMLADEQEFYAATGQHFIPTPAKYKKDAPFLKEVDSQALVQVHQNLKRAFQFFFDQPDIYGYPSFKNKKNAKDTYQIFCHHYDTGQPSSIYLTEDGIRLPKAKIVKAKIHRRPLHWWTLKYAVITRSKSGKYYCSLLYQYPVRETEAVQPDPEKTVGLNYSMAHFYTDSDGYQPDPPHWLRDSEQKLAEMQRKLSRMTEGSRNYKEQLRKIQLLHEHIANQRRDFIHKESRRIVDARDAVCVRGDNLADMSRVLKLGNVYDSGFGKFRLCLAYKLERAGKRYITVDQHAATVKTCRVCGCVNENLHLRDRTWICPHCGALLDREENAAINIREEGLRKITQNTQSI